MDLLEVEDKNGIRTVTINNVRKKNALSKDAYLALADVLNNAGKDEKVKCVVLTGKGDFFSSGNDLTQNFDAPEGGSSRHRPVADMVDAFVRFPKLLVAIINGPTIGISATIVALCDIIYASETAYFYAPFTSLGLCAEGCASITFPRILGPSKANEVLQLNHRLTAQEALDFKFVAFVYKDVQDIWKKLNQISELPLGSIIANKKLTRKFEIENLIEINDCEMEEMGQIFNSDHAKQARQKFLQMRRNKSKL